METFFVIAVVAYTGAAAVTDWRMHRIPNWLTVPAAVLGLAYHSLAPTGWGVLVSLAGFAVGFGLLLIPWLCGGGGMGDVKLLAALGAWLGPWWLLVAFAFGAMLGSLAAGLRRGSARLKAARPQSEGSETSARRAPRIVPFAVPVAMSTWAVLVWLIVRGG